MPETETVNAVNNEPSLESALNTIGTPKLIAMGCERARVVAEYNADLKLIAKILVERPEFDVEKKVQEIETPAGYAIRKVTDTWIVNAEKVAKLRDFLKEKWEEFVTVKTAYVVRESLIPELKAKLGDDYARLIDEKSGYSWTAKFRAARGKDPVFDSKVDKGAYLQIVSEAKVTFKPKEA